MYQKQLIIVCTDDYKDMSRRLVHHLAKIQDITPIMWDIAFYEQNEFQQVGARNILFVGNPEENKFTKAYLPNIEKNLVNNNGVCYGYDGSKAVIFGEGKLEQGDTISEIYNMSKIAGCLAPTPWSVVYDIVSFLFGIEESKKKKKIRAIQTEAAANLFVSEKLESWLDIHIKNKKEEEQ